MKVVVNLLRLRNRLLTRGGFAHHLISTHLTSDRHLGLGGMEPHWMLELRIAGGAKARGLTLYLAKDCFQNDADFNSALKNGQVLGGRIHARLGGRVSRLGKLNRPKDEAYISSQGLRLPWQVGMTRNPDHLPEV